MNTIYIPQRIETAEQAEALPEGAVAFSEFDFVRERCHGGWAGGDGETLYSHADMTGYVALVPIEAEEETVEHRRLCGTATGMFRRYVTPWEVA